MLPFLVMAFGAAVWIFAAIGVVSVAEAIGPSQPPRPDSLLRPQSEVTGTEIAGLVRFDGSSRSEYRQILFEDVLITEAEYTVDAPIRTVQRHYLEVFRDGGWAVDGTDVVHGEWTYAISRGSRVGTVEVERVDGLTEIEIELTEPAPQRGPSADR